MKIKIEQTHHTIADFKSIKEKLYQSMQSADENSLTLFPELFLTGYPLQDLCLSKNFIEQYQQLLQEIDQYAQGLPARKDQLFLMGGLDYHLEKGNIPCRIFNVIYGLYPGGKLEVLYHKRLLPNYDIFDERKYFTPGDRSQIIQHLDHHIALMICEDMWPSTFHDLDPVKELERDVKERQTPLSLVVNLSASPYHLGKKAKREQRALSIAQTLQAPFVYVNRVGAEDEILFDGASFVVNGVETLLQAESFTPTTLELELPNYQQAETPRNGLAPENTWEGLFSPHLQLGHDKLPTLTHWSEEQLQEVWQAIVFSLQDYAQKNGFQKFLVALSGGIDSALVLALVHSSLREGQQLEALFMPGNFTARESYELSLKMCQNLAIPLKTLPIKFLHATTKNNYRQVFPEAFEGLTDENVQSRLRGMLLFARSNQNNSMVINTSNKSEIAVGYSTLYGDSVGAISLLGDLYKSEVYQLAQYINNRTKLIPEGIITRAPSAELREGQRDDHSLPPYPVLDAVLEGLLSYRYSCQDLIEAGFEEQIVQEVFTLLQKSEYKRQQFCPIIKLKTKSFGFGHRMPISKTRQ